MAKRFDPADVQEGSIGAHFCELHSLNMVLISPLLAVSSRVGQPATYRYLVLRASTFGQAAADA